MSAGRLVRTRRASWTWYLSHRNRARQRQWTRTMSIQIDRIHTLAATRPLVNGQPFLQHASARVHLKPSSPETHPHDDRQSQMEQALKRSVTLVIWYRSNCDPIRLTHEISTFPLFSLSHYPSVVSDLELTPTSYVDTYSGAGGHWEQHLITTVRTIESEQRLLYKLRKSLLAGLADDECTGLAEELALQVKKKQASPTATAAPAVYPTPSPTSAAQLKRPLADAAEVPSAKRFYFPESYSAHVYIPPPMGYMLPTQTIPYAPALSSSPLNTPRNGAETGEMSTTPVSSPFHGPNTHLQSPVIPSTPLYSPLNTPNTATGRTSFPQHPHPPLKRWPNDYTVSEIAAGFRAMDTMVAQSPTATQKAAFERVFGCRYVKSTVCRHRGVYRKADASVRSLFEAMGNDERAVWGEFVRRVEGRPTMGKGSGSGDEKGLQDETGGQPGQNASSVGMGQDQQGQTGPDGMIAPMGHLGMQAVPERCVSASGRR